MAIVGTHGDAAVSLVAKSGGSPLLLDSVVAVGTGTGHGAMDVVVDGDTAYWIANGEGNCCGQLMRSVWSGSPPNGDRVDYVQGGEYFALAQDPSFVYAASKPFFSDETAIHAYRKSNKNIAATRGVPVGGPIAVDLTDVYFVLPSNEIRRISKSGLEGDAGTGDPFATTANVPTGMVLDDEYVYWTIDIPGSVVRQAKAAPSTSSMTIASGPGSPGHLALYGDFVYWTDPQTRSIWRAPKAGGAIETVASDQESPSAIAVDESGVYWTNLNAGTLVTSSFGQ
jgi:hypothetical protein